MGRLKIAAMIVCAAIVAYPAMLNALTIVNSTDMQLSINYKSGKCYEAPKYALLLPKADRKLVEIPSCDEVPTAVFTITDGLEKDYGNVIYKGEKGGVLTSTLKDLSAVLSKDGSIMTLKSKPKASVSGWCKWVGC